MSTLHTAGSSVAHMVPVRARAKCTASLYRHSPIRDRPSNRARTHAVTHGEVWLSCSGVATTAGVTALGHRVCIFLHLAYNRKTSRGLSGERGGGAGSCTECAYVVHYVQYSRPGEARRGRGRLSRWMGWEGGRLLLNRLRMRAGLSCCARAGEGQEVYTTHACDHGDPKERK
ncbi:hypothetical protein PYCCODRAFT_126943 [Trametes coccinea BRFM310]|uniref:Uncharacterized protein n=1 Tax=Trametes coccinea (strain BRFM310) TaxID=1353009 RepID=A0A1Y2ISP0_TRAC3|nr:hypothetical protein PYCCODRAFT_126943 [Trametes coccinea BRFM310]